MHVRNTINKNIIICNKESQRKENILFLYDRGCS